MKIQEFIDDLNHILRMEYGAVLQYVLHTHRLFISGHKKEASELLEIGNDEIRHSEALAKKIKEIGGKPTIAAEWSQTEDDLETMLKVNLASEEESIRTYDRLIEAAQKEGFLGLKTLLREQCSDEIRHVKLLKKFLDK